MKTAACSAALCALLIQNAALAQAGAPAYGRYPFDIPRGSEQLVVVDLNGDGLNDLVVVIDQTLRFYFQRPEGFDFDTGFSELDFSGQSVGWDLSSNYSEDGRATLITLLDGAGFYLWPVEQETIQEPKLIKDGLPGFPGKGLSRLRFSRDINGDGREDLVIPGAADLHLFIADGAAGYQPGLSISSQNQVRTTLEPNALERRTGQAVRIPFMELRDVNGDGNADLVSRTEERLNVFIADPAGPAYFKGEPSYSLDIAEIEERLGEFDIDRLDFSNLTGVLALTHEEILDDVDGDGVDDLLLREGGKVSLFMGAPDGMNLEQPRQVLRSSGNVLSTFLHDENEDGLKDLWLWRVEPISVGDLFVWLALSGNIGIEAFVYPNDGERFARRPSRKLTVSLRFPSVMRLAGTYREISSELRENQEAPPVPSRIARLDEAGDREDLLVLINNQVELFLNSIEPEEDSEADYNSETFLGALGYSRERDRYEINVREIIDNIAIGGNRYLDAVAGRRPDLAIDLATTVEHGDLVPVRLNADALDDVFVFTRHDAGSIQGILLLSE